MSGSVSVVPVEKALLAFCSDQLNLSSLQGADDHLAIGRAAIAAARQRLSDLGAQLERVTAALIAGDGGATPIAFVRAARDLEAQIAAARQEEALAESDLARSSRRDLPAIAEQWRHLVAGAMALDYDARMQVRQLVAETFERIAETFERIAETFERIAETFERIAETFERIAETFERIVIYHCGITPEAASRHIDLVLMAKGGTPRMLRIDRKSGSWMAQEYGAG